MKKFMLILLSLTLVLSFSTNAFASSSEESRYHQGIILIEQANAAIDEVIYQAVEQAEHLQRDYFAEIHKIEEKEVEKAQKEIDKRHGAIASGRYSKSEVEKLKKEILEYEAKLTRISLDLESDLARLTQDIEEFMQTVGPGVTPTNEALYKAVEELTKDLNKNRNKYATATDKYVKKLNKTITDCYDVTLAISNEAISKAAEKGVLAECSWKLVRFGHLWVWIDPIRIIGRK